MQQVPSVSRSVTSDEKVFYYLNDPTAGSARFWCGEVNSTQDYILYFSPTIEATESNLFKQVSYGESGAEAIGFDDLLCIPVNQE